MTAKNGDTLFVHYTGTLADGQEFDSSRGGEPLEFILGQGTLIPGFENAVLGKKAGDKVSVLIPPEEAYGPRTEEMVLSVPRAEVPAHITPEVGMRLELALDEGELDVIISRVTDEEVELDGNHPLAGESLHFDIEIVRIKEA
jgi:peptidylprolyl isomerase